MCTCLYLFYCLWFLKKSRLKSCNVVLRKQSFFYFIFHVNNATKAENIDLLCSSLQIFFQNDHIRQQHNGGELITGVNRQQKTMKMRMIKFLNSFKIADTVDIASIDRYSRYFVFRI